MATPSPLPRSSPGHPPTPFTVVLSTWPRVCIAKRFVKRSKDTAQAPYVQACANHGITLGDTDMTTATSIRRLNTINLYCNVANKLWSITGSATESLQHIHEEKRCYVNDATPDHAFFPITATGNWTSELVYNEVTTQLDFFPHRLTFRDVWKQLETLTVTAANVAKVGGEDQYQWIATEEQAISVVAGKYLLRVKPMLFVNKQEHDEAAKAKPQLPNRKLKLLIRVTSNYIPTANTSDLDDIE
jgi:hypothetical protein